MCGLENPGLVDQNWLERNLSALLLRTLVVGRGQQSESNKAALDMEGGGLMDRFDINKSVPLLVESHNVLLSRFGSSLLV